MKNWFCQPAAKYTATMVVSLGLYAAALVVSLTMLQSGVEGPWKYAIALLPVLPVLGVPFAVVRYCQAMDELRLRKQLESLAFGFAATAIVTFTYGFLQNAGLPDVSWVWVWPVMGICWLVGQAFAWRRYR